MVCAILLLACEPCSRWGRPPALVPVAGDCLVNHLARAALEAGGSPVVRVLGSHAFAVAARTAPAGVQDVFNPDWARGQGSSIACGLRAALLGAASVDGVVIVPCSNPPAHADHLRACVEEVLGDPARIVQTSRKNAAADCALLAFGRAYFPELLALEGDAKVEQIAHRHLRHRVVLPFAETPRDRASPPPHAAHASAFLDVIVRSETPPHRLFPRTA